MVAPKYFLLKQIIGNKKSGLNSLGELHAKHIDDIAEVMNRFLEVALEDIVPRLNKGQMLSFNNKYLYIDGKKSIIKFKEKR
jgi:hypothetical protein